jgi:hypothetical protein
MWPPYTVRRPDDVTDVTSFLSMLRKTFTSQFSLVWRLINGITFPKKTLYRQQRFLPAIGIIAITSVIAVL